jgi:hypothetical protein
MYSAVDSRQSRKDFEDFVGDNAPSEKLIDSSELLRRNRRWKVQIIGGPVF